MKGGEAAKWVDEEMADTFLEEAQAFVRKNKRGPFFLYYALQQPHVPRTPHPRFVGKTDLGPRGDAIYEADWCVGELMKTLEEEGLTENTLIIFSSDNGPVLNDGYKDQAVERNGNHASWGPFRGGKYSLFQAGSRVPFIAVWPGQISPGISVALLSQIDLQASLEALVGAGTEEPAQSGLDSENHLNALFGKTDQGRESLVLQATGRTAFRSGDWSLIPPYDGPTVSANVNIELGNALKYQLYHLPSDPGETRNLASDFPEVLQELQTAYESIRWPE
jgi:arylsulfatase A-like enzyme